MKRILLADDNLNLRSALRLLLETRLDVELVIDATDMEHLLTQIEDLHPDCIILDWELPGRPTRRRLPILRRLAPGVKVLALSARPESKQNALREGADAFVCKTESPIVILNKLHEMKGRDNEFLTCTFDQV